MHTQEGDMAEALGCLRAASQVPNLPADVEASVQYMLAGTLLEMRHLEAGEACFAEYNPSCASYPPHTTAASGLTLQRYFFLQALPTV